MNEVLFFTTLAVLLIYEKYNQRKLKESLDRLDAIEAAEKFHAANFCKTCHAKLRIRVGSKKGEFLKECPEGCEAHFVNLEKV